MKAVIMAGGEGSRLRPLTCALPKPMVPILNRPCMEHIVDLLARYNISQTAVTLQYLPDEIKNYFGEGKNPRSSRVELAYFTEDQPLGTAGSVKNAASFLDETFVVISGDALTDCNLQKAFDFHRRKGALATLVLTSVTCPLEYGVVITDEDGRILRFLEKPGWGEVFSDTVNTGIYILEPEILNYIDNNKKVDFSKDLFPYLLAAGAPLYAFVTDGYWCDIGNVEQYMQAHFDLLERNGELLSIPAREVSRGIWLGDDLHLDPSVSLTPPVLIGDGCVIGPHTAIGPWTVLGNGVQCGRGSSIKRSILWDNSIVREGVELRGTIIGKGTHLLSGVRAFEGSVIGDRSVVGEGSVVKPGIKVWPEKWVEKGSSLSSSLVWGNCSRARLFGSRGITGELFTEITPDFSTSLGLALGSGLTEQGRFSLATDGYPDTNIIKNAILSGLMSTGVQAVELGRVSLPVHRYGIRAFGISGGVHIHRVGHNKVNIRLMNKHGADYSRDEQRKLESLHSREEYRYAMREDLRLAEYMPGVGDSYIGYLLKDLARDLIKEQRYRIVVDYDHRQLGALFPGLFAPLGCQMITSSSPSIHSRGFSELLRVAEEISALVREEGAHFGAVLDSSGEGVVLIDDQGTVVDEDRFLALLSLITMQSNQNSILALPVTAPESVVEMARQQGGEVRRIKTAPWAMMQTFLEDDLCASQQRCPQYVLYNDALAVLVSLTEYLAYQARPLSTVLADLPSFVTTKRDVKVDWDDKGKVLRRLAEDSTGERLETAEGIKVRHPQGWALVLPDADEPVCRVYGEAFDQEIAESITEMYEQKIQDILN